MKTVLKIGPADHGRAISLEDFLSAHSQEGYHYEIIDGRLYVSPVPNRPERMVERWINDALEAYAKAHPEVINFVDRETRVFVPARARVTAPEPDVAAYSDVPLDVPFADLNWQDISPVLVVEVTRGRSEKDFVRKRKLYFQVPSIREYWILDTRESADRPTLHVHRRYGKRWRIQVLEHGEVYTTRLLPGFSLTVDPHA